MSVVKGNHAGSAGSDFYSYKINQSLRFDRASSTNLTRTAGSPSDGKKATWSWWMKKSDVVSDTSASYRTIFYSGSPNSDGFAIAFMRYGTDHYHELIVKQDNGSSAAHMFLYTDAFYRDVSSWYHFVVSYDSTDSTAADRIKIYVNGTRQTINTSGTNINPSLNHIPSFQVSGKTLRIGEGRTDDDEHIGGYLAEVNFIDGTAYDASNFGETKDGVWVAKDSSGLTFGNNGFYLPFDDSSAIGDDESSNTNDFTANNFSAHDIVPDSPTNNFCTMNILTNSDSLGTSEGSLEWQADTYSRTILGTFGMKSGKWYWETLMLTGGVSGNGYNAGIANHFVSQSTQDPRAGSITGGKVVISVDSRGDFNENQGTASNTSNSTTFGPNDIIGIALDLDSATQTIAFYKNNTIIGSARNLIVQDIEYFPEWDSRSFTNTPRIANFGQDSSFAGTKTAQGNADGNGIGDFYYAPPSGYLALCTKNLPNITIGPEQSTLATDNFNTVLYTGNNATNRTISGFGFNPDWNWLKSRSIADNHVLTDILRGTNHLHTNTTAGDSDLSYPALTTDGFIVSGGTYNNNNVTFVSWAWKAGGSGSSNSDGSITSSVSANTAAGFSIVSWTGTGSNATIGHGLSSAPQLIIAKNRDSTTEWPVLETVVNGATKYLRLDTSYASTTTSVMWNNTNPTDSVFSIGTYSYINEDTKKLIAYCFHSVEGYSKVGSYTGNGSTDGTFVFTGFRPAWIMFRSSGVGHWIIFDDVRHPSNVNDARLYANLNNDEDNPSTYLVDFLSNGFKLRHSGSDFNTGSQSYIYLAFADQPFKFSNAR